MVSLLDEGRLSQIVAEIRRGNTTARTMGRSWVAQAAGLILERLLAAEVEEALGRENYRRRRPDQAGYRNGYKQRSLKTAEGKVGVDVPQVRGLDKPFCSPIWKGLSRRSPVLQKLAVEMYARGLSTRDIEELLGEVSGEQEQTLLSRSAVSQVSEQLWKEYEAFCQRDLGDFDVVYLFCDAVYESLRRQAGCRQAVLVTWGICSDGAKVLLHMSLGNKESADAWLEHFRSLVKRNMPSPLTITTDGAPGAIRAVETMWPASERIRCWFHKMKNVLEKVPEELHATVKRWLLDVRDAPDHATGQQRAKALIERYRRCLPSAMACLAEDLEASLAHLKLPSLHQRMVRTTNLCERSFLEERRRSKVIPRFFDEKSCLKLVFASLGRASQRWNGVRFTAMEKRQLQTYIRGRQAMGKKVRDLPAA